MSSLACWHAARHPHGKPRGVPLAVRHAAARPLQPETAPFGREPWKLYHEETASDFFAKLRAEGVAGEALTTRRLVILLLTRPSSWRFVATLLLTRPCA